MHQGDTEETALDSSGRVCVSGNPRCELGGGELTCVGRSVGSCSAGRACCCPGEVGIPPPRAPAQPLAPTTPRQCRDVPWVPGLSSRGDPRAACLLQHRARRLTRRNDGELSSDGGARAHSVQWGGRSGGEGLRAALGWLFRILTEHNVRPCEEARSRSPPVSFVSFYL